MKKMVPEKDLLNLSFWCIQKLKFKKSFPRTNFFIFFFRFYVILETNTLNCTYVSGTWHKLGQTVHDPSPPPLTAFYNTWKVCNGIETRCEDGRFDGGCCVWYKDVCTLKSKKVIKSEKVRHFFSRFGKVEKKEKSDWLFTFLKIKGYGHVKQ